MLLLAFFQLHRVDAIYAVLADPAARNIVYPHFEQIGNPANIDRYTFKRFTSSQEFCKDWYRPWWVDYRPVRVTANSLHDILGPVNLRMPLVGSSEDVPVQSFGAQVSTTGNPLDIQPQMRNPFGQPRTGSLASRRRFSLGPGRLTEEQIREASFIAEVELPSLNVATGREPLPRYCKFACGDTRSLIELYVASILDSGRYESRPVSGHANFEQIRSYWPIYIKCPPGHFAQLYVARDNRDPSTPEYLALESELKAWSRWFDAYERVGPRDLYRQEDHELPGTSTRCGCVSEEEEFEQVEVAPAQTRCVAADAVTEDTTDIFAFALDNDPTGDAFEELARVAAMYMGRQGNFDAIEVSPNEDLKDGMRVPGPVSVFRWPQVLVVGQVIRACAHTNLKDTAKRLVMLTSTLGFGATIANQARIVGKGPSS